MVLELCVYECMYHHGPCLIPICHLVELAPLIAWSHDLVNSGDRTLPRKWLGCIEHEPIKACHRAGF